MQVQPLFRAPKSFGTLFLSKEKNCPQTLTTISSGQASNSICPYNWQLPNGGTGDKSFYYLLISTYGGTVGYGITGSHLDVIAQLPPLSFVRSGYYYYDNGALYYRGSYGYYWSSTANSATTARSLYFYSTYLSPQSNGYKGNGFSVRCLVR